MAAVLLMVVLFWVEGVPADDKVQTYEFTDIHALDITAVTGSVDIKINNEDKVVVIHDNNMEDPKLLTVSAIETEGYLSIQESLLDNEAKGTTAIQVLLPATGSYKTINCLSAIGQITLQGFTVDSLKAHAASMPILVESVRARSMALSTAMTSITLKNCEIGEFGKLVTSDGVVDIDIPRLPSRELDAASSFGAVNLRVPTFGDSFQLILSQNEDMGRIISPFECVDSTTQRFDENDTYRTHRCILNRGSGGPKVDLLTASGTIRILSENMYEKPKIK